MGNYYTPEQMAAIDRDNRQMAGISLPMSGELEALRDNIASGSIGITSLPGDVDSMCLGGGEFSLDTATAPPLGTLLFAWKASRFFNGYQLVAVSAGSLTLVASSTNYVQVNRAGVVSANTTGFGAGQLPLWVVVTGVSSWQMSGVTSNKPHLSLIGSNGVTGAMLSTAGQTKEQTVIFGAISAASTFLIVAPNVAATLALAEFINSVTVAASDTNYWTWAITNLGAGGAGSTAMLAATAANTTKATGGSGLTANVPRALTLHGTPGVDTNLNANPNDVIQVTLTPTGSPTNLAQAGLRLDFTFQG